MYARHLALCCLLYVSTAFGHSHPGTGKNVVVYLKPSNSLSASALAETKNEVVTLMSGMNVHIAWWDPRRSDMGTNESLIVADFSGECSVPTSEKSETALKGLPPLAETSIVDGHILPFAHVDCDALHRFVGALVAEQPSAQRDYIYGRAIARLLAHELYHIVAQTREHATTGVAKESFSKANLLSDHFEFESTTLADLPFTPEILATVSPR